MTDNTARPPIHLVDSEAETLANLALAAGPDHEAAAMLLAEIERAETHTAETLPPGVVTMGAVVSFVDEGSGAQRSVTLVYPREADIAAGRISILTLVGAGLIGLSQGQIIRWPDRSGRERHLRIESVQPPA
jgi:regulator of nucleoside diphosphate kinase